MPPFEARKGTGIDECAKSDFAFENFCAFLDAGWSGAFGTAIVCNF